MKMIALLDACYLGGYKIRITFNTGESGVVDLESLIRRVPAAAPLIDTAKFAEFRLDEWPTLVWPNGFDLAPETLYELVTNNKPAWSGPQAHTYPLALQ
jgi:hypothetical protein